MAFKEFHCQQVDPSNCFFTLCRCSCFSFRLPRKILSKSWDFFRVLLLNEVFAFTTNSYLCPPLFLENFAISTLWCQTLSCFLWFPPVSCILVLGSRVCERLEGNAVFIAPVYCFYFLFLPLLWFLSFYLQTWSNLSNNNNLPSSIVLPSPLYFYCQISQKSSPHSLASFSHFLLPFNPMQHIFTSRKIAWSLIKM